VSSPTSAYADSAAVPGGGVAADRRGSDAPVRAISDAVSRRDSRPVAPERHFRPAERVSGVRWSLVEVGVDIDKGSRWRGTRSFVAAPSGTSERRMVGALKAIGATCLGEVLELPHAAQRPGSDGTPTIDREGASWLTTEVLFPSAGADRRAPGPSCTAAPGLARCCVAARCVRHVSTGPEGSERSRETRPMAGAHPCMGGTPARP
jgi:hypothetical protein